MCGRVPLAYKLAPEMPVMIGLIGIGLLVSVVVIAAVYFYRKRSGGEILLADEENVGYSFSETELELSSS